MKLILIQSCWSQVAKPNRLVAPTSYEMHDTMSLKFFQVNVLLRLTDTTMTDIFKGITEEEKKKYFRTPGFDARFPNQNQTRLVLLNIVNFRASNIIFSYSMHYYWKVMFAYFKGTVGRITLIITDATRVKGEDYEPCEYFKWVYKNLCPRAWVSLFLSDCHKYNFLQ